MALTRVAAYIANVSVHMYALSTDVKPTAEEVNVGERLFETDTRREFEWTGSAWILSPRQGVPNDGTVDAFHRRRVSSPTNLWVSEFQYDKHPLYFDETLAVNGSATHKPNESAVDLAVTAENGSKAKLTSFEFLRYQPGKSQGIDITFVMSEMANTTVKMVRRTKTSGSVVDNKVAPDAWEFDPLDGSGPSQITLDITNGQLFHLDIQWLSLGRQRSAFDIDGALHYAHGESTANVLKVPSTTTANLPICWELITDASNTTARVGYFFDDNGWFLEIQGDAAAATLKAICSTVYAEGGDDAILGHTFGAGNGGTLVTGIGTSVVPLMSVRPALLFNSITNRIPWKLESIDIWADDAMHWELIYLPDSLTGASFGAVDSHSMVELDVSASAISGGIHVTGGYIAVNNRGGALGRDIQTRFPFTLDLAGTDQSRCYTIVVQTLGGTNKNATAEMNWVEGR